jgi:hypothetical protein
LPFGLVAGVARDQLSKAIVASLAFARQQRWRLLEFLNLSAQSHRRAATDFGHDRAATPGAQGQHGFFRAAGQAACETSRCRFDCDSFGPIRAAKCPRRNN